MKRSPTLDQKASTHSEELQGPGVSEDQEDVEDPKDDQRLLASFKAASTAGVITQAFEEKSFSTRAAHLVICFLGLQAAYITWGLIQEKIMTQPYGTGDNLEYFNSSAFLVFSNRFLGLFISLALVYGTGDSRRRGLKAPLLEFAPSSLSNILSSWAQYEALKYVTFPTQVLSKSGKIIPVMLVGKLLHRRSYPWSEYGEAALITLGVTLFGLNEKKPKKGASDTDSAFGIMLLIMYLTCDSFTSQWQDKVFKKYQVNQFQMMLGINICSLLFTGASLLQSGQGWASWQFMLRHPDCSWHITLLSISSAVGQLFIFHTIKKFGPVIFTIMMTVRQMLSMVISCILFGHPIAPASLVGAGICFGSIGLRIRRNLKRGSRRSGSQASSGGANGGERQ